MGLRVLSVAVLLLLTLMALAPGAVAQPVPELKVKLTWEYEHEHNLPETGGDNMKFEIRFYVANTTCAHNDPAKRVRLTTQVDIEHFVKWAGASIVPDGSVFVEVPNGEPGAAAFKEYVVPPDKTPVLNLKWNLEDRPRTDAKQDYVIYPVKHGIDGTWGGSCFPQPQIRDSKSRPMTVTMDDVVEQNATDTCDVNTDPDKCLGGATTQAQNTEEAPLFDFTVLLVAIAGLAFVMRRRR